MTLSGGTFAKGTLARVRGNNVGIAALTLVASGSTIDFGVGTVGALSFASLNAGSFTLRIDNWTEQRTALAAPAPIDLSLIQIRRQIWRI